MLERGGRPSQCRTRNQEWASLPSVDVADEGLRFLHFSMPGAWPTWRSTFGTVRRFDFICGSALLLTSPHDTWVDRDMDVATVREDHLSYGC